MKDNKEINMKEKLILGTYDEDEDEDDDEE